MEDKLQGLWIPMEIWQDERLTLTDRVIFSQITALDKGPEGCRASNAYLAKACRCSERQVSGTIARLIALELVKVQPSDGRRRKLRVCMAKSSVEPGKNHRAASQNLLTDNKENNKENNKERELERKKPRPARFNPPTENQVSDYAREYIASKDYDYDFPSARFVDHYAANGWRIGGKAPMRDWQAAVRSWIHRESPPRVQRQLSQEEMERIQSQRAWEAYQKRRRARSEGRSS